MQNKAKLRRTVTCQISINGKMGVYGIGNGVSTSDRPYTASGNTNGKGWHTMASESTPADLDLHLYYETLFLL